MKKTVKLILFAFICIFAISFISKDSFVPEVYNIGEVAFYYGNDGDGIPKNGEIKVYAEYNSTINPDALKALVDGLLSLKKEIDLSAYRLSGDDLNILFGYAINNNPSLFYVSTRYLYSGVTYVNYFKPTYKYSDSEIAEMQKFYSDSINKIVSLVNDDWSETEKALFLHDYLAAHYEYDTGYNIYDAYNFFLNKKGVCQAYSIVYGALLKEVGIESTVVTSDEMSHAWNKVKIDGEWYNADVTWDDPVSDRYGKAVHEHFLLSDDYLSSLGYENWVSMISDPCTSTKYDGYSWKNSEAPFVYLDGYWYCIDSSTSNFKITKTRDFINFDDVCNISGAYYSGFVKKDGSLVYSTEKSVIAYDPKTGESDLLKTQNKYNDMKIYGITDFDGTIFYCEKKNLNTTPRIAALETVKTGDINADGSVTSEDLLLLRKYLAGGYGSIINHTASDYDGSGNINMKDASLLKRRLAG